jgi:hypothetical protein
LIIGLLILLAVPVGIILLVAVVPLLILWWMVGED